MKFVIIFFISIIAFSTNAATVNLKVGDIITLQPNTLTTVTCGSNSDTNCQLPIQNLETKLNLCRDQLNTVEDCITEFWPLFKRGHSNCIEEAYQLCVGFCKSSPVFLDCLTLCK